MTNQLHTAIQVNEEINNTNKLYEKKKITYYELLQLNDTYQIQENNLQINIDEIKIQINSLESLILFGENNSLNNMDSQSMKNDYISKYTILYDDLISTKFHISNIEIEIHKLNIEFNAFEVYIDNLSKLIPRINRWGNIDNMTQFQLDCEACSNNIKFKTQISIMDFNPPKLERN